MSSALPPHGRGASRSSSKASVSRAERTSTPVVDLSMEDDSPNADVLPRSNENSGTRFSAKHLIEEVEDDIFEHRTFQRGSARHNSNDKSAQDFESSLVAIPITSGRTTQRSRTSSSTSSQRKADDSSDVDGAPQNNLFSKVAILSSSMNLLPTGSLTESRNALDREIPKLLERQKLSSDAMGARKTISPPSIAPIPSSRASSSSAAYSGKMAQVRPYASGRPRDETVALPSVASSSSQIRTNRDEIDSRSSNRQYRITKPALAVGTNAQRQLNASPSKNPSRSSAIPSSPKPSEANREGHGRHSKLAQEDFSSQHPTARQLVFDGESLPLSDDQLLGPIPTTEDYYSKIEPNSRLKDSGEARSGRKRKNEISPVSDSPLPSIVSSPRRSRKEVDQAVIYSESSRSPPPSDSQEEMEILSRINTRSSNPSQRSLNNNAMQVQNASQYPQKNATSGAANETSKRTAPPRRPHGLVPIASIPSANSTYSNLSGTRYSTLRSSDASSIKISQPSPIRPPTLLFSTIPPDTSSKSRNQKEEDEEYTTERPKSRETKKLGPKASSRVSTPTASKVDEIMSQLGPASAPSSEERPKRTTRAAKKREVVLIELSDDEEAKESDDSAKKGNKEDTQTERFGFDPDFMAASQEITHPNLDDAPKLYDSFSPYLNTCFTLQYFQDDVGMGHIAAEASQNLDAPPGISFDSDIKLTISKKGISFWKALLPPKARKSTPKKAKASGSKSSSTASKQSTTKNKIVHMDVDEDESEEDSLTPKSTKHFLLLAHILPWRILEIDAFAQPGVFFIHTSKGRSMTMKPRKAKESSAASFENTNSSITSPNESQTTVDMDQRETIASSRKKRKAMSENETGEKQEDENELGPKTKKTRALDQRNEPSQSPSKSRTGNQESQTENLVERLLPTNNEMDLFYEVDENDTSTSDLRPLSAPSKTKAKEKESNDNKEKQKDDEKVNDVEEETKSEKEEFEEKESTTLFVLMCDRPHLNAVLHLLMALSQSRGLEGDDPLSSDTSEGEEKEEKTKKKPKKSKSPENETKSDLRWFEIFGRTSDLKPIQEPLINSLWNPLWISEADKQSAKLMKSPARLKAPPLSPIVSPKIITLPKVYSHKELQSGGGKGQTASQEISSPIKKSNSSLLAKSTYCSPYSIGTLEETMTLISNNYERVRDELFGKVWPFCLIIPPLRGIFAHTISSAPGLYNPPPSKLFHQSTIPIPKSETLRPRKSDSGTSSRSVPVYGDKNTPIIEYPKQTNKTNANKDKSADDESNKDADEKDGKSGEISSITSKIRSDSVLVAQRDIDVLQPGIFLNDIIINFWLLYLQHDVVPKETMKRVKIFSTYFFSMLLENGVDGPKRVQNWMKDSTIFDYEFVVVPINLDLHWTVAIICNPSNASPSTLAKKKSDSSASKSAKKSQSLRDDEEYVDSKSKNSKTLSTASSSDTPSNGSKNGVEGTPKSTSKASTPAPETPKPNNTEMPNQCCILYLDSLSYTRKSSILNALRNYVAYEAKRHSQPVTVFDGSNMPAYSPTVPQQPNFTDCGLFLLHNVELFVQNLPNDLSKQTITSENSFMGPDWFDPSDLGPSKRKTIANTIDTLVKSGYGPGNNKGE